MIVYVNCISFCSIFYITLKKIISDTACEHSKTNQYFDMHNAQFEYLFHLGLSVKAKNNYWVIDILFILTFTFVCQVKLAAV